MSEQTQVIEIDGPPKAYIEIAPCGPMWRFIYKTIVFVGKDQDAVRKALDAAILAVGGAVLAKCERLDADLPLIVWRQRPMFSHDDALHVFKARCRLATIPDLSPEQWEACGVVGEGAEPNYVE